MKLPILIPLLAAFLSCFPAYALPSGQTNIPAMIYRRAPLERIDPTAHEKFSMMEREMQYLIFMRGDPAITNYFCIVGYQFESGKQEAAVIWQEANSLTGWHGHREPGLAKKDFQYADSLFFSKSLNLATDLVDTIDDIHGSTF